MRDLAVLVRKPKAEDTIAELEAEGVYDDSRKVREHDEELVELPVTERPTETEIEGVIEQDDPERRGADLEALLSARGWTDEELQRAPKSWAVIGSVILVQLDDCPRPEDVGEELLDLHGEAETVLARGGISGEHREPDVTVIAGTGDTETVHTEHGTKYGLDLRKVMFAPGNQHERARMGEIVSPDERVFDMFAGIGYFTLPMARAGAQVTAVERNPASFKFLVENAMLNDVPGRIDAYRADCREMTDVSAERVVMGYYDAHEYLDTALDALEPGGIVHMHETTPENRLWERPISRLESTAESRGRDVEILDTRRVKSHSEGVWHVVVDAKVE
ncbi:MULTISPECIES: class I SAM-dependent methyltransferase family protein [unclassified Haladaptatus]|uniref:class I SAM-dependent methyltransferase n=1 Tax=unclassified Haladaptatus TaxID=2622732 RepID=UPI00209BDFD4|nr:MULTISPECIES: class I SAM-dependent methyltransferase family protein [unclassified Haladaptatus]MCO8242724.1 class I SAM-dependent methyltransferase family protein [Haladaptatus sp. AB643]MCO8252483.1 class I SAM-dependent methyltransferase family protein [Haladaptatus sp. AB618]